VVLTSNGEEFSKYLIKRQELGLKKSQSLTY